MPPQHLMRAAGLWLNGIAQRVLALKAATLLELRKYDEGALPPSFFKARGCGCGRFQSSSTPSIEQQRQGGVHIQAAAEHVGRIADLLTKFRCSPPITCVLLARPRVPPAYLAMPVILSMP